MNVWRSPFAIAGKPNIWGLGNILKLIFGANASAANHSESNIAGLESIVAGKTD